MGTGRINTAVAGALVAMLVFLAGCGSEDHPNEPRPAAPIMLSALITDDSVSLAPDGYDEDGDPDPSAPVGAGLIVITVSNQSSDSTPLEVSGPVEGSTEPIVANGGTSDLKLDLEPGEYTVSAGDPAIEPARLLVGEPRGDSSEDLLLP